MEAETADLLDKRMMQLYGVMNKKFTRNDFNPKNDISKKINDLHRKIESEGMPEIGLPAPK